MRSLKVERQVEALLRQQILTYFLDGAGVYFMKQDNPFDAEMRAGKYDWDQVRFVRRSLEVAGLLERVSGTTADVELKTTAAGRQMLEGT